MLEPLWGDRPWFIWYFWNRLKRRVLRADPWIVWIYLFLIIVVIRIDFGNIFLLFIENLFHAVIECWILYALLHEILKMWICTLLETGHKFIYIKMNLLLSSKDMLLLLEYITDAEEFKLYNKKGSDIFLLLWIS